MKALVFGGSRFIGLHLVQALAAGGHDVAVFNRGQTQADLPPQVKRLYGDRRVSESVKAALGGERFDVVFDISGYLEEDLRPVLEVVRGRVDHYVFCSTTAVSAVSDILPIREDFPLDRGPRASDYAKGKIICEDLLLTFSPEASLPVTIIRPNMVYGPHNYIVQREFSFFRRIELGRKVIVPGDGFALLQFGHVDDLADAFVLAAGKEQAFGQVYNITGAEAVTINGYIRIIGNVMGKEPEILYLSPADVRKLEKPIFPYAWRRSLFFSIDKAREQLGFWPKYDIEAGLAQTYKWYQTQDPETMGFDFSYEDEVISRYSKA